MPLAGAGPTHTFTDLIIQHKIRQAKEKKRKEKMRMTKEKKYLEKISGPEYIDFKTSQLHYKTQRQNQRWLKYQLHRSNRGGIMAQVAQMLQRKWATRSREGQYEIYLVGNRISQNLRETESRLNEEREKAMGAIEQADYPYVEDWWDEGEQLNIEIREEAKDEASGGFDEGYRHRRANAPFRDSVPFDDSTVGSIGSTERRIHGDYEKAHESDDDMDYENSGEEKQDCRHDDEDNEDVDMELVYSIFSHAINKEKVQVGEPPEPMSPCTPTEPLSP